jgi:hypothetical protein
MRLYWLRDVWIESPRHPRSSSGFFDYDIVFHFLLEILEFSGNSCASPWSFTFYDYVALAQSSLTQFNALRLLRSRTHVEIKIN